MGEDGARGKDWLRAWVRMGQGVRTGLGHRGITCVLQTQFSSYLIFWFKFFLKIHISVTQSWILLILEL